MKHRLKQDPFIGGFSGPQRLSLSLDDSGFSPWRVKSGSHCQYGVSWHVRRWGCGGVWGRVRGRRAHLCECRENVLLFLNRESGLRHVIDDRTPGIFSEHLLFLFFLSCILLSLPHISRERYSWIACHLQVGRTLAFLLPRSDFKFKTSFGFLSSNYTGKST